MTTRTKTLASFIAALVAGASAYLLGDASAYLLGGGEPTNMVPQALFSESTTHGVPPARTTQPADIAATYDTDDMLVQSGGSVVTTSFPAESTGETSFRLFCEAGKLSYDDPILYPGQAGASHLHQFYGNPDVDEGSTWTSLVTAANDTGTYTDNQFTCSGKRINGSAYWHPAVLRDMDGNEATTADLKAIKPEYAIVYYKGFEGTLNESVGFPRGFSMIFGVNPTTGLDPLGSFKGWSCGSGTLYKYLRNTDGTATFSCPTTSMIRMYFQAGRCWNGTQLATANGRDHISDLGKGGAAANACPATHPYRIPKFELILWFTHNGEADYKEWYFSSDRMPGYPRYRNGETGHTDWLGGWNDSIFQTWQNLCVGLLDGDGKSCSDGQIGDGRKLTQDHISLSWNASSYLSHYQDLPVDPSIEIDPVLGSKAGSRVRRRPHRH